MIMPLLMAAEPSGTEKLAASLVDALGGLPPWLIVFIISMIPILELRGGILAASILGIPMWNAVGICVLGNALPIPFLLLFCEKVIDWLAECRIGFLARFARWLRARGTGPKANTIRKYEFLGLILFVGIPLPGTGGWTGSLIASLLHVDLKKSVPAICIGVLLAATIMCLISYGGLQAIIDFFAS